MSRRITTSPAISRGHAGSGTRTTDDDVVRSAVRFVTSVLIVGAVPHASRAHSRLADGQSGTIDVRQRLFLYVRVSDYVLPAETDLSFPQWGKLAGAGLENDSNVPLHRKLGGRRFTALPCSAEMGCSSGFLHVLNLRACDNAVIRKRFDGAHHGVVALLYSCRQVPVHIVEPRFLTLRKRKRVPRYCAASRPRSPRYSTGGGASTTPHLANLSAAPSNRTQVRPHPNRWRSLEHFPV